MAGLSYGKQVEPGSVLSVSMESSLRNIWIENKDIFVVFPFYFCRGTNVDRNLQRIRWVEINRVVDSDRMHEGIFSSSCGRNIVAGE